MFLTFVGSCTTSINWILKPLPVIVELLHVIHTVEQDLNKILFLEKIHYLHVKCILS